MIFLSCHQEHIQNQQSILQQNQVINEVHKNLYINVNLFVYN